MRTIAIELLSGEPPFTCFDCQKNKAWFEPRAGKALCNQCWPAWAEAEGLLKDLEPYR